MPELPEVETMRRGLLRVNLIGRRVERARVFWEKSIATSPAPLFERLVGGRHIASIERIGKFLIIGLNRGALWIHLRMSGKLLIGPLEPRLQRYARAQLIFQDETLSLIDSRKFARIYLLEGLSDAPARLGPDLLLLDLPPVTSASFRALCQRVRNSRRPIKTALLDQTWIAGIGNIYADEALWRARIHPLCPSSCLSFSQVHLILQSAKEVIASAVELGGTSLGKSWANFCDVFKEPGSYQKCLAAYRRTGLPCPRCGQILRKLRVNQRTSHFCPSCQSPPI